jgi:Lon protease-like protein
MPLQIFEQRYIDLVRETMRNDCYFGVIWIRRGSEIVQKGSVSPELGDYGVTAKIVDWDQLSNGLLGITIEGVQYFDLVSTDRRPNGLVVGEVELQPEPVAEPMREEWQSFLDVLRGIEDHPHVQRMNLKTDYNDAWQVAYTLIQLLPFEEALKYELQGITGIEELMSELDTLLNEISGED